jgi:C-terminal processing protease CtpA/Prc
MFGGMVMKPTNINEFSETSKQYYDELHKVLVKKQQDYGPNNIANAPGGPINGIQVRMYDKIARINNLVYNKVEPENESLHDSFLDLANYAIIAMMVLDGKWPESDNWNV